MSDQKKLAEDLEGDQIGWLVPAVPTEEGDMFWGYTSVPLDGVVWWRSLPEDGPNDALGAVIAQRDEWRRQALALARRLEAWRSK